MQTVKSSSGILLEPGHNPPKKTTRCFWDGCSYSPLLEPDLARHLKDHTWTASLEWSISANCGWRGCKSKAAFKDYRSHKSHLKNIHTHPLLCTVPKCRYKKPFRNQDDLSRHGSTAHSSLRPYNCPFSDCPEEIKTFARKDKWLKHIRETPHKGDKFCLYYHCIESLGLYSPGFQTLSKHFAKLH